MAGLASTRLSNHQAGLGNQLEPTSHRSTPITANIHLCDLGKLWSMSIMSWWWHGFRCSIDYSSLSLCTSLADPRSEVIQSLAHILEYLSLLILKSLSQAACTSMLTTLQPSSSSLTLCTKRPQEAHCSIICFSHMTVLCDSVAFQLKVGGHRYNVWQADG